MRWRSGDLISPYSHYINRFGPEVRNYIRIHPRRREDKEGLGYALRFPRLVSDGIRENKSSEDATTTKEVIEMFEQQKKTKVKD